MTETTAQGSQSLLIKYPVSLAAHAVAAGIYGNKARVTVVFTPIHDKAGTIDLAKWPQAIGALLKKDASTFSTDLKLIALTSAIWRPDPLTQPRENLPVTAVAKPLVTADEVRLASYWAAVMGGDEGMKALWNSLDPTNGSDPITTVMRKAEDNPKEQTPDFHGTGRSAVAVHQSFNRADEIVARIMGAPVLEIDEDLAVQSLSHAVEERHRLKREGKLHSKSALRSDMAQAAEINDDAAYTALKASRLRADAFARRRSEYQNATSPKDAIDALTRSHPYLRQRLSPLEMAKADNKWQAKGTRRVVKEDRTLNEELAAFRLASRTPDGSEKISLPLLQDNDVEHARRRLFTLQSNPSLSRLFRFVVDFQCDLSRLVSALKDAEKYPDGALYDRESTTVFPITSKPTAEPPASFLVLSFQNAAAKAQIWTTAKFRPTAGADDKGHFLPCTREEIDARAAGKTFSEFRDLAIAEQIDEIVDLGQCITDNSICEPRYDILTLDAITATGAAYNSRQQDAQRAYEIRKLESLPAQLAAELSERKAATQRGGGLALADRWRQFHAIGRHLESQRQRDRYADPNNPQSIILDASDLTVGYKLDTGLRLKRDTVDRNRWHTLMHRTVTYSATKDVAAPPSPDGKSLNEYINSLYPDSTARDQADDGLLQVPAALRDWTPPEQFSASTLPTEGTTAFTEEIIGAWRGDPLSLACGTENIALDQQDLLIDVKYNLPSNSPALTPPPLRFGWQYHFGLRAVFTGGISLPLNRAINHYEYRFDGDLIRPKADIPGHSFRRHERIDAPSIAVPDWLFGTLTPDTTHTKVALRGRFPAPQAGQMVVRSFAFASNRRIADVPDSPSEQDRQPGIGFDRRILLAPAVSLDFATLHGAFRGRGEEIERNVPMCEPRLLGEPGSDDAQATPDEQEKIEWVPAPPLPVNGKPTAAAVWKKARVAWRPFTIASRPRGGLRPIDYRAAWGGLPVYRASKSLGATRAPKPGEKVSPQPALMTDAGEILHRAKGPGQIVVVKYKDAHGHDRELRRSVLWSAVGALDDGGEIDNVDRSGTAVFRALPGRRRDEIERQPYYPDPAAVTLAVQVKIGDQPAPSPVTIELYRDNKPAPAPADYPHAIPVVLDVVRGDPKANRVRVTQRTGYGSLPRTPSGAVTASITVAHVTIILGPGEEAAISVWCVPSETFLTHMWAQTEAITAKFCADSGTDKTLRAIEKAFAAGLKRLKGKEPGIGASAGSVAGADTTSTGLGGLPILPAKWLAELTKIVRADLLAAPIPEIAAVTTISAVHAIDLPQTAPQLPKEAVRPWALLRADAKTIGDVLEVADDCGPLCEPANWKIEHHLPGAIDVLLDGTIAIDGQSTAALEIRARGIAAARGRFDDIERGRSRDDRARGLWPKPDSQNHMDPKRLFGFMPVAGSSVQFDLEAVTLLRIEGFESGKQQLDLLAIQRTAREHDKKHDASKDPVSTPPLRVYRPPGFPDARARLIEIFAVAMSRHTGALRTRYDELPEVLHLPAPVTKDGKPDEIKILHRRWLPATIRPARPSTLSPIPSFHWADNVPTPASAKIPAVTVRRSMRVRMRLKRPWFSSGEGERLGVVIWPPNLFESPVEVRNDLIRPAPEDREQINLRALLPDGSGVEGLQDADMGLGGSWVSRWGADPIRSRGGVQGWLLSKHNFLDVTTPDPKTPYDFERLDQGEIPDALLVRNVRMPVPVDSDAQQPGLNPDAANPPGGFMVVSLITYAPKFDPEQEAWFVDLNLSPCGAVYPFLRLGIVRFQPHAPESLRVSEPVVEWVQLMPERTLTATAKRDGTQVLIEATLEGALSYPTPSPNISEISPEQAPQVHFSLLQRRPRQGHELAGAELVKEMSLQNPNCGSGCMTWKATFAVPKSEYEGHGGNWSIFAEEFDRMRPATYPDEPRYNTLNDKNFADTGPRFAARLALDNLAIP